MMIINNINRNLTLLAIGACSNPCCSSYAGSKPFSEIETKSMSKYIQSISDKFYAYISFHSFKQLLMFPYGYTKEHVNNHDELVLYYVKNNVVNN